MPLRPKQKKVGSIPIGVIMSIFWIQHGYNGREALKVMDHAPKLGHQVKWGRKPPKDIIPIGDVDYCESFLNYKPEPDFAPLWLSDHFHRRIEVTLVPHNDQCWEGKIYRIDENHVDCEMHDLTDPTMPMEIWSVNRDVFVEFPPEEQLNFYWHVNIERSQNRLTLNCLNYRRKDVFVKSAEEFKKWPPKIIKKGEPLPTEYLVISDVVQFVQEWRYYVANGEVLATGWYDGSNEYEPAPELNIKWPKDFCGAVDFGRLSTGEIALVESQAPYACGWYGDNHDAYIEWLIKGWSYMHGQGK